MSDKERPINGTGVIHESPISEAKSAEPRRDKRTTVRFSNEEFERIEVEAALTGLSLPRLLKNSHFGKAELRVLFSQSERHWICAELRRIGNNVNQIAKKVNSGVLEGWHSEFLDVAEAISKLHQMAAAVYGVR